MFFDSPDGGVEVGDVELDDAVDVHVVGGPQRDVFDVLRERHLARELELDGLASECRLVFPAAAVTGDDVNSRKSRIEPRSDAVDACDDAAVMLSAERFERAPGGGDVSRDHKDAYGVVRFHNSSR